MGEGGGGGGMLWTKTQNPVPAPGALWLPGRTPEGFPTATSSARAQEIARSREELLGLLRDVPESDHELSLTDLVEKRYLGAGVDPYEAPAEEEEEVEVEVEVANNNNNNNNRAADAVKEREKRSSGGGGGGGWRSSSDGVLLNMYFPTSLTRSLTAGSRSRRGSPKRAAADFNKRDREPNMFGCCWRKARRR